MTTQAQKSVTFKTVKNRAQARNIKNNFFVCTQDMIVYKKIHINLQDIYGYSRYGIATLLIPKGTLCFRSSSFDENKCRAEQAKVLSITAMDKKTKVNSGFSGYSYSFNYKVGSIVKPSNPFSIYAKPCESGIHFFLTQQEARKYDL